MLRARSAQRSLAGRRSGIPQILGDAVALAFGACASRRRLPRPLRVVGHGIVAVDDEHALSRRCAEAGATASAERRDAWPRRRSLAGAILIMFSSYGPSMVATYVPARMIHRPDWTQHFHIRSLKGGWRRGSRAGSRRTAAGSPAPAPPRRQAPRPYVRAPRPGSRRSALPSAGSAVAQPLASEQP